MKGYFMVHFLPRNFKKRGWEAEEGKNKGTAYLVLAHRSDDLRLTL